MKLIVAIVHDTVTDEISQSLTSVNLKVTHIASTGGFLRHGHSTLLIGLEDDQVETALKVIREKAIQPVDSGSKRAVILVLKVDQYTHF